MEIRERNIIIIIISIVTGIFLLIFPVRLLLVIVFSVNPIYYFTFYPLGYICLDLLLLAITLLLYAYFLIRPIKALRRKKILVLNAMIFGSTLIILPIISFYIDIYNIFSRYEEIFYWFFFEQILSLILLIPGVSLFIHGRLLNKFISSGEKRQLVNIGIRGRKIILVIISLISGTLLLIFAMPYLIFIFFYSYNVSIYFTTPFGYLYIDLLILTLSLFCFVYFLIEPIKTIRRKNIIALSGICFGGISFLFAVIAIYLDILLFGYMFSLSRIFNIILYLVVFLTASVLFTHGWFLKKSYDPLKMTNS